MVLNTGSGTSIKLSHAELDLYFSLPSGLYGRADGSSISEHYESLENFLPPFCPGFILYLPYVALLCTRAHTTAVWFTHICQ